jgi:Ca2+-binding RTX toxin-like protein
MFEQSENALAQVRENRGRNIDILAPHNGPFDGDIFAAPSLSGRASLAQATGTAFNPAYLDNTLPMVIGASLNNQTSLSTIVTDAFGPGDGGYKDFWIGYYGAAALHAFDFSYWNLSNPHVATWLVNGSDIGASTKNSFNSVEVTSSTLSTAHLKAGNDIGDLAFVTVPVAFDSHGNPTEYDQFSVIVVAPSMIAPNAGDGAPTPQDIIASASRFSNAYSGIANDNDCHKIACAVAGAAGAAFDDFTTGSLAPAQNESGGFWRVVYRGSDPHPVSDWQTLVKPGDIVRMGWQGGGQHTTTVLAVNANGTIKVFDNDAFKNNVEIIGTHNANYDTQTIADTITIYRLSADHLYLINGTGLGEQLAGTKFSDQIEGAGGNDKLSGWTGNDHLNGGAGNDVLTGSSGKDLLNGGAGADKLSGGSGDDTFVYTGVSQSTGSAHDTIAGFNAQQDKFALNVSVHAINAAVTHGTLGTGNFDANLTAAIGSHLKAHDAILFTASAGNENGHTFLVVDANGHAGYQAGADYVFDITGAAALSHLSVHDFT